MSEIKLEMQIEFFRNIDFGARAEPSSDEETAQKGQDAARKLIFKQRNKIQKMEARTVTPQVIAELTDAYEELRRLVQTYKVEPDTLLDYLVFLYQQHLYDTGIEVGHWLENFYRIEPPSDDTLSRLKSLLGLCYYESNQYDRAEQYYKEELEIEQRLVSENPYFYKFISATCNNLGLLLDCSHANRPKEAERYYREALEIYQHLAETNPATYETDLADTYSNLGFFLSDTSRPEEGEQYL